jgi:DNA-binding Lrp family transcriptional regulator
MITKLQLSKYQLLVYAIIYGFSQDGETSCRSSRKYFAEFIGVSLPTIDEALKKLCEKDLIIKETEVINNVAFNSYKVNLKKINSDENENFRGSKEALGGSKEALGGSKATLHNNNNINNNKKNICINTYIKKYGEYENISLTEEQYNRLTNDYFKEKIDYYISKLDEYCQATGKKYKDYNCVLRRALREEWFKKQEPVYKKQKEKEDNTIVGEIYESRGVRFGYNKDGVFIRVGESNANNT